MFSQAFITALLAASAHAAQKGTHGVMMFWSKPVVEARMDPIISPGALQSQHVHTVMGGNGFSVNMGEMTALNSKCTGAKVFGDNSNYWFPTLFFEDPKTGKFEKVDFLDLRAYYKFDATDDEMKPFPPGFQMVSGDPFQRSNPYKTPFADHTAHSGDDEIQPVSWSCGRKDGKHAYPENVSSSRDGTGSTQGPGFPDIKCDGVGSQLASYIHFPQCADLSQPFSNYANNTAWPNYEGGKLNCPKGYTHVPHIFLEIRWDAMKFADRWTEGPGKNPFVLANGDKTGFGGHADFFSGWDTEVLQHLIDTCYAAGEPGTVPRDGPGDGIDSCPSVRSLDSLADRQALGYPEECTAKPAVAETITGVLDKLPGCNPIQAGPGRASMCDCSNGTPVCDGKVPSSGGGGGGGATSPKPSSTTAASPSATKPATGGPTTMTTSTSTAANADNTGISTIQPGDGEDEGEEGDDEEDDDDNTCVAPEEPKPKASPVPMIRRHLGRPLTHDRFHNLNFRA